MSVSTVRRLVSFGLLGATLLSPPVAGQSLSVGVSGGAYPNRDLVKKKRTFPYLPAVLRQETAGYVIGPSLELQISKSWSVSAEAFYKPLHYQEVQDLEPPRWPYRVVTLTTWEFPVLLRWKLSGGWVRPLFEGGASVRTTSRLEASIASHFGATAGAGFEARWGRFALAPVVRFTHWADNTRWASVQSQSNQFEALVRLSWTVWGK